MRWFRRRPEPGIELDENPAFDDAELRAALVALDGGDTAPAAALMAATRGDFDRRPVYASVLGDTVEGRAEGPTDTATAWPDLWVAAEPDNPDAHLVRYESLLTRAWEVRGGGWASTVGHDAWPVFRDLLRQSAVPLHRAAELHPADPSPWAGRLLLATVTGGSHESMEACWGEIVTRDRYNRWAHNTKLNFLCEKWRGSHEQMFGFARSVAASAPLGSPLVVLPLRAAAEWTLWKAGRDGKLKDFIEVSGVWRGDQLRAELDAALEHWFHARPVRHAKWYDDLNYLAYGLIKAGRDADARPVFEAIGPFATELPWGWMPEGGWRNAFQNSRRSAMR